MGRSSYEYPNDQDAATLWYHDHAHGRTSRTLYYGLLAFYVLEDELERELDLPGGDYDVPVVLADHAFNRDGSFRYQENVDLGFRGDTLIVNGVVSPRMRVERRRYRFRFLNASNGRSYTLRLGGGRRMVQIAGDGGLLERPVGRTRVPLHPGERADLVIDFARLLAGDRAGPAQRRRRGAARCRSCASTSRAAAARTSACRGGCGRASRCPPATPLASGSWRWAGRPGRSTGGSSSRTGSTSGPRLGSTERWTFVNRSNRVHPMHIHGFLFRILSRSSGPVNAADRLGWKDTIGLLPNETVTVLAWFAPYGGTYVFHCHALEHADKAMMLQLEVTR